MHSFRISPERAIDRALDVIHDVHAQFDAGFDIITDAKNTKKEVELQANVIMTMQEMGQYTKGCWDRWFDIDHDFELFPFVHYQKMIDAYVGRLVAAQKNLVSCKYAESTARRTRAHMQQLEDEIGDLIYKLKSLRKFVVSHERYWAEKENIEKREQNQRELMLKKERNAIEQEKLYIEREKLRQKRENKRHENKTYNVYDVTVVEYFD